MIRVIDVHRSFGNQQVLRGVNLRVPKGEILVIIGRSGSGKTVLLRLLIGLAELSYTTGDYDQALRYVEEGLKEAQRTSSQKYVALGWALRGKIIAKLGDTEAAGSELQRAFTLADQLQSPSLIYPIAYDFGQWNESTGKEREATTLYGKAKATIEQMITAVEDETLRSTFRQSALVQDIYERATRLGG